MRKHFGHRAEISALTDPLILITNIKKKTEFSQKSPYIQNWFNKTKQIYFYRKTNILRIWF